MKVIAAHRQRVKKLLHTISRLLELEKLLHDARSQSWQLQSHYSETNQATLAGVRETLDGYEAEIDALTNSLRALPQPPARETGPPAAPGGAPPPL